MKKLRKRFEDNQGSLMAFVIDCDDGCPCNCPCTCPVMTFYTTFYGDGSTTGYGVSYQYYRI